MTWLATYLAPHILLHRPDGRVAMLRRAGSGYRDGWLCPPAGRIEYGEDVLAGAVREGGEEAGVVLRPELAEPVHTMHRWEETLPGPSHAIIDVWFRWRSWDGEPHVAEPDKATELVWIDPDDPPADVIPHCAAALKLITAGVGYGSHGWESANPAELGWGCCGAAGAGQAE
jgi:8-oxo-dGTP pyrophosphatase MutT (NUDIX family)